MTSGSMHWKDEVYVEVSTDAIIDILTEYHPEQLAEMLIKVADAAADWGVIREIHERFGEELEKLDAE